MASSTSKWYRRSLDWVRGHFKARAARKTVAKPNASLTKKLGEKFAEVHQKELDFIRRRRCHRNIVLHSENENDNKHTAPAPPIVVTGNDENESGKVTSPRIEPLPVQDSGTSDVSHLGYEPTRDLRDAADPLPPKDALKVDQGPSEARAGAGILPESTPGVQGAGSGNPKVPAAEAFTSDEQDLTGLALSGGGIRSATFCLGVLQGLAEFGLLKRFDYLSTVSGGGYIGAWLVAWIRGEADRDQSLAPIERKRSGASFVHSAVRRVELQLSESRHQQVEGRLDPLVPPPFEPPPEPQPIFHLRSYASYLSPKLGLGSTDTWVMFTIYLRNLLLNQAVLLPLVMALVCGIRTLVGIYALQSIDAAGRLEVMSWLWLTLGGASLIGVWLVVFRRVVELYRAAVAPDAITSPGNRAGALRSRINEFSWPLTAAGLFCCFGIADHQSLAWKRFHDVVGTPWFVAWPTIGCGLFWALTFTLFRRLLWTSVVRNLQKKHFSVIDAERKYDQWKASCPGSNNPWVRGCIWSAIGAIVGFCIGLLLRAVNQPGLLDLLGRPPERYAFVLTFGPPLFWISILLLITLQQGLYSRYVREDDREWTASVASWALLAIFRWLALFGLVLYGPLAIYCLSWKWNASLAAGWVGTTLSGLLAGKSALTGAPNHSVSPLDRLARLAPGLFALGLFLLAATAVDCLLSRLPSSCVARTPRVASVAPATDARLVLHVESVRSGVTSSASRASDAQKSASAAESTRRQLLGTIPVTAASEYLSSDDDWNRYFQGLACPQQFTEVLGAFVVLLLLSVWLSFSVGVNTFSLQTFYQNRLVRCYLGASRPHDKDVDEQCGAPTNVSPPPRRPNVVTGFAPFDDFPLANFNGDTPPSMPGSLAMQGGSGGAAPTPTGKLKRALGWTKRQLGLGHARAEDQQSFYPGPYPILNTALNLVGGDDLAWQERKAESFILSPFYCGSADTGYRPTNEFAGKITLGTAMATSGAALSPNMGYHSTPAVGALLTFFNMRLGSWFGNPAADDKWTKVQPRSSLLLLLKELFGQTTRRSDWIYLSDGGHFENLGIYELVRRRVRFIVACDGDADGGYSFGDLGSMVRKCRSEFGVPIDIDVDPIKPRADSGRSTWHCSVGVIRYDLVDPQVLPGVLVYLKTSLTGDEPSDVLNYSIEHPTFPQQTTANQFFTESQFEAYRALGHHVCRSVFEPAMRNLLPEDDDDCRPKAERGEPYLDDMSDAVHRDIARRLFRNLRKQWAVRSDVAGGNFIESVSDYLTFVRDLRHNPQLTPLVRDFYPEMGYLQTPPVDTTKRSGVEQPDRDLATALEMAQIIEEGWMDAEDDRRGNRALSRGWLNTIRRWSQSDLFRRHWLLIRGEFVQGLIRFCEEELNADPGEPALVNLPDANLQLQMNVLINRFKAEWPSAVPRWSEILENAAISNASPMLPAQLIEVRSRDLTIKLPVGFVLFRDFPADAARRGGEPNKPSGAAFEVLIWIAGPFRHLGIGTRICRKLLTNPRRDDPTNGALNKLLQKHATFRLVIRYPNGNKPGEDHRERRSSWLSFFQYFDFRELQSAQPNHAEIGHDLLLYRNYPDKSQS